MAKYYKENFYDEYAIKKEDIIIAIVDSGSNARKICDELNNLYEDIIFLKRFIEKRGFKARLESDIND